MLGFGVMKKATQKPIVFDITHALQQRDPHAKASGGRREQFMELARAGVATGLAGVFIESHPDPAKALCDGPSAIPLGQVGRVLDQLTALDRLVKGFESIT